MRYFSTNRTSQLATFREAVLNGQPDDEGLYFPSEIPSLSKKFLSKLTELDNATIAFEVIKPYVASEIDDANLFEICSETVNFDFPLVSIDERIAALELFHGPTLAFKDVGARFMSRCLRHFSNNVEKTVVIVATSGDTGGAVAAGFHNIGGIEVVILYPKGKVSRVQELQLTTLGGNITTLALHGSFDECQHIAKTALADKDLRSRANFTSANSINVARWLPQQFYYFFALKQWQHEPPVISVPSGNFGNVAAGMLAHVSGLPVKRFIAACNANDVVPRYMRNGEYTPSKPIQTLSNAMDVGSPSNFVRILEIFGNKFGDLKQQCDAVSVSDDSTAATMRQVSLHCNYILDPHGAVGYRALADYLENHPTERGIFLETAHPAKFDSVSEIIGVDVDTPGSVTDLFSKQTYGIEVKNYDDVKDVLLCKI